MFLNTDARDPAAFGAKSPLPAGIPSGHHGTVEQWRKGRLFLEKQTLCHHDLVALRAVHYRLSQADDLKCFILRKL
jgi:hypothetical protein